MNLESKEKVKIIWSELILNPTFCSYTGLKEIINKLCEDPTSVSLDSVLSEYDKYLVLQSKETIVSTKVIDYLTICYRIKNGLQNSDLYFIASLIKTT